MKTIEHNLKVATPSYMYFINNMSNDLSRWIQYRGVTVENDRLVFKFKSSKENLSFTIYAGVNRGDVYYLLLTRTDEIYDYFKNLKNESLGL